MKDGAVRLGHDLRQHVESAAVRHADHDFTNAERAAALDDLLERRNHRFAAVQPEAFGSGELYIAEFLEALGFHEFIEDGAFAFTRERNLLIRAFDAFLDPALLRGAGDMEEFDAERLTIRSAQNADDLAYGAEFEPEHVVEKDAAIEIALAETVRSRIELFLVLGRFEPERIEHGVEVAAPPIGADQHQRPDRIAGGALDLWRADLDAARLRLFLQLAADCRAGLLPIAIKRSDQVVSFPRPPSPP